MSVGQERGCERCGRAARYRFLRPRGEPALRCLVHAVGYPPLRARALRVAAVVGSLLFLINHADVVLSGRTIGVVWAKIALTFVVPFVVATFSALQINRIDDDART